MQVNWDFSKPEDVNPKTWRRQQILKYIKINPDSQPMDVLAWMQQHTPNPWPSCDANKLGKIVRRLKKSMIQNFLVSSIPSQVDEISSSFTVNDKEQPNLSLCKAVIHFEVSPLFLR